MRRIAENPPSEPHDVVIIHRPIRRMGWNRRRGPVDLTVGVLVDGTPLCIPKDSEIRVSHDAGGPTTVTISLIVATVEAARLPMPKAPKRGRRA